MLKIELGAGRLVEWSRIPMQTKPSQRLEDLFGGFASAARLVGILDAQNEFAAVTARDQPIVERGPCAAEMEKTAGRGREASYRQELSLLVWSPKRDPSSAKR